MAEALEGASVTMGDQPVEWGDVIRAAETRAAGRSEGSPLLGGMAEEAHDAAEVNAHRTRYQDKIKLADILMDATELLPQDKVVTAEDARRVADVESRYNPNMEPYAGGLAAAARINENREELRSRQP